MITDIFSGLIATYIFLLFVKLVGMWQVRHFIGGYFEIDKEGTLNTGIGYEISLQWGKCFFTPVPSITLYIQRRLTGATDNSNWEGLFSSDILNLFSFKGVYKIKDRSIANHPGKDMDGWFEITLFNTEPKRIGFNQTFLKTNKEGEREWHTNKGYIIQHT